MKWWPVQLALSFLLRLILRMQPIKNDRSAYREGSWLIAFSQEFTENKPRGDK